MKSKAKAVKKKAPKKTTKTTRSTLQDAMFSKSLFVRPKPKPKLKSKPKSKTKPKSKSKKKTELAGSRVKLTFRRHWLPPIAGLLVAILVFGFFNSQLLSARIAYYLASRRPVATLDSQTIASPIDKNAPPEILINRINAKAPIVFEAQNDENLFEQDLQLGVVHYPGTALPGQVGNVAIFGHSSSQWWEPGDYKYVFTLLDKIKIDDKVFIDYKGTRYIYKVYNTKIVDPTDVSVLNQGSDNNLTLITCWPLGVSSHRLIISARQYVPKVTTNTASTSPASLPAGAKATLPSNDSSFWHSLRELF